MKLIMNKKRVIIIAVSIIILLILVIFIIWPKNQTFLPIENLSKENSSLDKSDIKELNNNYYQELKRLNLFSEELTYLSDDKYQDDNYIGRFVSEEGYTYQFTINITDNTVKIIEIAQIQIDRENLEHNYGGIGG